MTTPEIHFVISAPRSGSTWLAQALNQHSEVFATEQRLFGNFCEMWPNNNGKLAPRITLDAYAKAMSVHYFHGELVNSRVQFIESFIKAYCQFLIDFGSKSSGKSVIVDKITPYPGTTSTVVRQLQKFFPNSKIIRLIRDGRDVQTSGTFDWLLKDGHGTDRYKCFVENDSSVVVQRFFDDETIKKWAANWKESVCDVKQFDLEVRYENMLAEMPHVLNSVFDTIGVEASEAISRQCAEKVTFEKMTGRRNGKMDATAKQRSGISGQWRDFFTRRDGQLFHAIAGDELISLGYCVGDNWFGELPEKLSIRCDSQSKEASQS